MKGKNSLAVFALVGIALVFLGLFGWVAFKGIPQQTVVGGDMAAVTQTAVAVGAGLKTDDAATLKTRVYDLEATSNNQGRTQVATRLYLESWNGDVFEGLLEDNTTTSASTTTSTSTAVGKTVKAYAFQDADGYYAEPVTFKIASELETKEVFTHNIANSLKIDCYDDGADVSVYNACNLTLAASQVGSLDYIRFEVNKSLSAFNFKSLMFDVNSTSNINDIDATGTVTYEGFSTDESSKAGVQALVESAVIPQRLRNTINYRFDLPNAVMLHQYDVLRTGPVTFTASSTNPEDEPVIIYAVDESYFKSVASGTGNKILSGVENDESTAKDVGGRDVKMTILIG